MINLGDIVMKLSIVLIVLVLSINSASAQQGDMLQQSIDVCRSNSNGLEVTATVNDTAVVFSHSSWSNSKIVTETVKGHHDFEDMRLTIKGVLDLLIFLDDDVILLANPMEIFGKPNCFITSHQLR